MFLSLVFFIWSSYKVKFGHLFSDIVLCSTKTTNFFISRSKIFEALSLKDKFNGGKGDVLNQQFQFNFEGGGGGFCPISPPSTFVQCQNRFSNGMWDSQKLPNIKGRQILFSRIKVYGLVTVGFEVGQLCIAL